MNLQLTLAVRYLSGRKLRTALTTLAIIFGVMLIFGMNAVMPTMIAALQANVQGAEGESDFTITNVAGDSFPADVTSRLQDILFRKSGLPRAQNAPTHRTQFQTAGSDNDCRSREQAY